jgi:glutamate-1-semialdehyde aminotransferase
MRLQGEHRNAMQQLGKQHKDSMTELEDRLQKELQSAIDRLKIERQVNRVEDWLNLYASIIFHLKKLRAIILNDQAGVNTNQIDNLARDIDSLLKEKFYLISNEVVTKWIVFNNNYHNISNVKSLIDQLIEEYNKDIRKEYKKLLGIEIPRLDD